MTHHTNAGAKVLENGRFIRATIVRVCLALHARGVHHIILHCFGPALQARVLGCAVPREEVGRDGDVLCT